MITKSDTNIHLLKGTKCRFLSKKKVKKYGEYVIFVKKGKYGNFLFESPKVYGLIICYDESEFIILPTKNELQQIIDLSLDMKWKDWFHTYSNQLSNGLFN